MVHAPWHRCALLEFKIIWKCSIDLLHTTAVVRGVVDAKDTPPLAACPRHGRRVALERLQRYVTQRRINEFAACSDWLAHTAIWSCHRTPWSRH